MEIQNITILTHHLDKIRHFYGTSLGFDIHREDANSVTFKAGKSTLTFTAEDQPAFYHFAFGIPFDKLSEAFTWMEERAEILPVEGTDKIADFKNWNAKSFYFHDPAGNIVEFIARYDWIDHTQAPFSISDIISINEIGIVSTDIKAVANELENSGLNYYARGPKFDDFMPMGDDSGLLLLCSTGKGWMPTGRPARQFWTKVSAIENGKEFELTIEEK